MARGRMINTRICADVAINAISNDTSRLAFTWLITFADSEGRTYGDPAMVRSMVYPRRADVTVEAMERYISEWASLGLIVWYEAEGDRWIWFPSFEKNQMGLDRRKEPRSAVPPPPQETCEARAEPCSSTYPVRTGCVPGTAEKKRTEEKRSSGAPTDGALLPVSGDLEGQEDGLESVMTWREIAAPSVSAGNSLPSFAGAPSEAGAPKAGAPHRKRASKADPRTSHPAIAAVYALLGRNPPLEMYDEIIAALGEQPNAELLQTCRKEWLHRGYSEWAWDWLVEWYAEGGPPGRGRGNGRSSDAGHAPGSVGTGHNTPRDGPPLEPRAVKGWKSDWTKGENTWTRLGGENDNGSAAA